MVSSFSYKPICHSQAKDLKVEQQLGGWCCNGTCPYSPEDHLEFAEGGSGSTLYEVVSNHRLEILLPALRFVETSKIWVFRSTVVVACILSIVTYCNIAVGLGFGYVTMVSNRTLQGFFTQKAANGSSHRCQETAQDTILETKCRRGDCLRLTGPHERGDVPAVGAVPELLPHREPLQDLHHEHGGPRLLLPTVPDRGFEAAHQAHDDR